jgi:hypothetical protein
MPRVIEGKTPEGEDEIEVRDGEDQKKQSDQDSRPASPPFSTGGLLCFPRVYSISHGNFQTLDFRRF